MIIHHVIIGILLFSTATRGRPSDDPKGLSSRNTKSWTRILKRDISISLNEHHPDPNPLDIDLSPEKNKVKRQTNSTTSTEKSIKSATDSKDPNLAALEESFGGNTGAAAENVDESLPPPRRTGFYHFIDWNTFLEVGEDGGDKVSIRFSPQAGDPSRFLRVNVP